MAASQNDRVVRLVMLLDGFDRWELSTRPMDDAMGLWSYTTGMVTCSCSTGPKVMPMVKSLRCLRIQNRTSRPITGPWDTVS